MPTALAQSEYQTLLNQIDAIYARAQQETTRAVNVILTQAYWQIGKHIVLVEQKNKLRAQYGAALLKRLSKDLTEKYGEGFSETNLGYMRQFYVAYPISQAPGELDWTRYQLLSTIQDEKQRQTYERRTIREDWSSRELAARLRRDRVRRLALGTAQRTRLSPTTQQLSTKLSVTRGILYTYKLAQPVTPTEKGEVFVDCGFNNWRPARLASAAALKSPVIETTGRRDPFEVLPSKRTVKDLYTYKACVVEVIDGDTLRVEIDLGLRAITRQKLRLRGIDAPEIDTAAGRKAKRFVQNILKPCPFIILKTYWSDKYGRYLTDLFYLANQPDAGVVVNEGIFLNQQLLNEGLARSYQD